MRFLARLIKKPLGCLLSLLVGLLLLVVMIGVVGVLLADHFVVDIATHELQQRTGFGVTVGQQEVGLVHGLVDVHDIQITNPSRFASPDFLKLNELKLKLDPGSLRGPRLLVDEVVVDLDSLAIVQDKDGEFNFEAIQKALTSAPVTAPAVGPKTTDATTPPFTIKQLTIRLKTTEFFDFQSGDGQPKTITVNYEQTFNNVTEANLLQVEATIGTALADKGFGSLTDALKKADPAAYLKTVQDLGGAVLDQAVPGAENLLKSIVK
jgi:hypothetical protein